MSTFKQERIDKVMHEISRKTPAEIAHIILDLRFDKWVVEYERDWLDELANHLRGDDVFNEMELHDEFYGNPKKELIKRYKNQ